MTDKRLQEIARNTRVIMWIMVVTVALSAVLGTVGVVTLVHAANVANSPAASANSNCASQGGFDENC